MAILPLPKSVVSSLRTDVTVATASQCVVELVLNSIDAGATVITVRVDLRNFKFQVVDNGYGISLADLHSVGSRYMTSKCQSLNDLQNNLSYYGFRGEALCSIIEVSGTVRIVSRAAGCENSFCKVFTQGVPHKVGRSLNPLSSCGTSITIADFLCNRPVRRNRIKPTLDLEEIKKNIEYIALINPHVSFHLKDEVTHELLLQTSQTGDVRKTFEALFGSELSKILVPVKETFGPFKFNGYIGKEAHPSKNFQFIYLNKRLLLKTKLHKLVNSIMSRSVILKTNNIPYVPISEGINHGVFLAFSPPKREKHAVFLLNISCPYSEYDITIDPKKTLVEFSDWNGVLCCIEKGLRSFIKKEAAGSDDDGSHDMAHVKRDTSVIDEINDLERQCASGMNDSSTTSDEIGVNTISTAVHGLRANRNLIDFSPNTSDAVPSSHVDSLSCNLTATSCSRKASSIPGTVLTENPYHGEQKENESSKCSKTTLDPTVELSEACVSSVVSNKKQFSGNDMCSVSKRHNFAVPKTKFISNIFTSNHFEENFKKMVEESKIFGEEKFHSQTDSPVDAAASIKEIRRKKLLKNLKRFSYEVAHEKPLLSDSLFTTESNLEMKKLFNHQPEGVEKFQSVSKSAPHSVAIQTSACFEKKNESASLSFFQCEMEGMPNGTSAQKHPESAKQPAQDFLQCKTSNMDARKFGTNDTTSSSLNICCSWKQTVNHNRISTEGSSCDKEEFYPSHLIYSNSCNPSEIHCTSDQQNRGTTASSMYPNDQVAFAQKNIESDCFPFQQIPPKLNAVDSPADKKLDSTLSSQEKSISEDFSKDLTGIHFRYAGDSNHNIFNQVLSHQNLDSCALNSYLRSEETDPYSVSSNPIVCDSFTNFKDLPAVAHIASNSLRGKPRLVDYSSTSSSSPEYEPMSKAPSEIAMKWKEGKRELTFDEAESHMLKKICLSTAELFPQSDNPPKLNFNLKSPHSKACEFSKHSILRPLDTIYSHSEEREDLSTDFSKVSPKLPCIGNHSNECVKEESGNTDILSGSQFHVSDTCSLNPDSKVNTYSINIAQKELHLKKQQCLAPQLNVDESEIASTSFVNEKDEHSHLDEILMYGSSTSTSNGCDFVPVSLEQHSSDQSDDWIEEKDDTGKLFYIHRKSGLTLYTKPNFDHVDSFSLNDRPSFLPKGMSPIIQEKGNHRANFGNESQLPDVLLSDAPITKNSGDRFSAHQKTRDYNNGSWPLLDQLLSDVGESIGSITMESQVSSLSLQNFSKSDVKVYNVLHPYKFSKDIFDNLRVVGQLDKKFIVTVVTSGNSTQMVVLFDQHAVHERIRVESLTKEYQQHDGYAVWKSAPVEPELPLVLSPFEVRVLASYQKKLNELGLAFSVIDSNTIGIQRVPTCLLLRENREVQSRRISVLRQHLESLIREEVDSLLNTRGVGTSQPAVICNVISSEACRGAIKFGDTLSIPDCQALLHNLSSCSLPFQCAHGRPALVPVLDISKIKKSITVLNPNLQNLKRHFGCTWVI